MLVMLVTAVLSYVWMEHKLDQLIPPRLPKIPKPRHKVKGYRYLEDYNSDETGSEDEGQCSDFSEEEAAAAEGELPNRLQEQPD